MSTSDIAVSVKGLSKAYTVAHEQERHVTLAEQMLSRVKHPFRKTKTETFWALKDISFEIKKGEVVGIMGRNGAGKSTLLKILSRITEPTEGKVDLYGRVGSLLEVGTGFHPELSGRENVFLNGHILGMRRTEITRQFDAIVDFAGVEQFLDMPVKRYSSGMYVRLAFAVAAYMDTEILIVDEVLAVGDAEFQKKCLSKMKEVTGHGRTVLFVSHNVTAMEQLCTRGILLQNGGVELAGSIRDVMSKYGEMGSARDKPVWIRNGERFNNDFVTPERIAIVDSDNQTVLGCLRNNQEYWVEIDIHVNQLSDDLELGYGVSTVDGTLLYWSFHTDCSKDLWPPLRVGRVRLRSPWSQHLLNEGTYRVEFLAALHQRRWLQESGGNSARILVEIAGGLSTSPHFNHRRFGLLAPVFNWTSSVQGE